MLKSMILAATLGTFALPVLAEQPAQQPRGMMRYDTNKDGTVDRIEWAAGQEARFKQLDSNGDGKLSPDELIPTPAAARGALPADARSKAQSPFFLRLDTDKDGFISKPEFMAQADRNFARCDSDKDGRISSDECRQALRRQPRER